MRFLLLHLLLLLTLRSALAAVPDDFAAANEAYQRRDFSAAISAYETLIRRGENRPEIFHNLGLAYEQATNIPKAVLSFERALLLSPQLTEAQSHLDRLTHRSSVWWEQIPRFGSQLGAIAVVVGCWLFILALVARWRALGGTRDVWSALAALAVLITAISAADLYYREIPASSKNRAIVLRTEKLRSNFTESSPTLLSLQPGQAVEITSENGSWTNCQLPDKTRGWVTATTLERVIPRS